MTPPVSALGFEYVAPPYATRRPDHQPESIPYRFIGAADGTTLVYDPAVPGAPTSLSVGQVVEFETTLAFTVTAQDAMQPFFVGQYMSGCEAILRSVPVRTDDTRRAAVVRSTSWCGAYRGSRRTRTRLVATSERSTRSS